MIPAIGAALIATWASALLAAGEVCYPNKPIDNQDFRISCDTSRPPGVVKLQCKSEAERWSNFPKEQMNLTGFDVEIDQCGFPNDNGFGLLEHFNSLALKKIHTLKFVSLKTPLVSGLLRGISVNTLVLDRNELITELPDQLLHDMQMGDRFWAAFTNLTEVPSDFFLNQGNITYVDLNYNQIEKLNRTVFEPLVKLKQLYLAGNQLTEIEAGLFDRLTELENLDISTNMLKTLPPNIFDNLKSLSTLHIGSNQLTELPADLLRNLKEHLTSFRMNINRGIMKTMPGSFFKNLRKLEIVELLENQFTSLPADLFVGAESLKYINLSKNELTKLPSRIFDDAPNLKKLRLSNNQLSKLPVDIFNENANLEELYLDNNRLLNITEGVLDGVYHLRVLDVSHNSLVDMDLKICDGEVNYNLKYVDVSYNNLTLHGAFTNCVDIRTINASNNNITKIIPYYLINKIQLEKFNLANNRITELPLSAISRLPVMHSLSFLNMSGNLISLINMTNLFEPSYSSAKLTVDLTRNPLHCDCYIYDFLRFLENTRWISPSSHFKLITNNLTCIGPPQFDGQKLIEVSSSELTCPLFSNITNDACSDLCACLENTGNKRLIVDCSNRNLKSVPAMVLNSQSWSIALNMSGNDLQITPAMNRSYLSEIISLDLSSNNISTVTLDVFSGSLRELQLRNNSITKLEPNVIEYLTEDTQLKNLTLHQNNWNCDCEARNFLKFVQTKLSEFQLDKVKCYGTNKLFSTMTANELCENAIAIIVGASLVIAFISIAVGVLAALYYKYQKEIKIWLYSKQLCLWFVTENELDKDKRYDAFISFSHKDEDFVVNEIINKLEEEPNPYKLCVHYRDWLAGEWITEQIARSVEESRRTIVVLSPNFLDSIWGGMEFRTAHNKALKEGRARVILILYGDIGNANDLDPELKAYLSMNTYVKWGDPWFWDKLRYALPHRYEPSRRKTRNARIMENHLAQMSVHAHVSNDKAEIIPMPNINATTHDSAKLLDPRSGELNRTVVKF